MSDLLSELVSEWLCTKGYFVIKGLKIGNNEVDVLAIRTDGKKIADAAHYEIQASTTPIGYLGTKSAKRMSAEAIRQSVRGYIAKKYFNPRVTKAISRLIGTTYRRYLVSGNRKDRVEVLALEEQGIRVIPISQVLREIRVLKREKRSGAWQTSGAHRYYQLLELAEAQETISWGKDSS